MRTLHLTTPHMKGPDVREVQRRLGVFVDGDFGPATGEAARAWKYRMGFPRKAVNTGLGAAAQRIMFRKKGDPLPVAYRARRIARLAVKAIPSWGKPPPRPVGPQAASYSHRFVGLTERPPGSNEQPTLIALAVRLGVPSGTAHMGFAWCAYFVFLNLLAVGSTVAKAGLVDGKFNALYVPTIHALASAGQQGLSVVGAHSARPGDLVIFNFDGGVDDHIGFLDGPINFGAGTLPTVEGNTSFGPGGSQSNGGCVAARKDRTLSEVAAFVRVSA